jgi:hypothetical protein
MMRIKNLSAHETHKMTRKANQPEFIMAFFSCYFVCLVGNTFLE